MGLNKKTAHELAQMLRAGEVSAQEIALQTLENMKKTEKLVDAFISISEEKALAQAKAVDEKIAKNEKIGALAGIPIGIKDNICTKGVATTCASRMLENFVPPYDATVMQKLYDADAVMVGKCNLDEFAMGSSCENSYFKVSKNPWNLQCVPGGSSGGSAVAVAASQVPISLGSDTGGSVRMPAAFCGVVGLKPTYGAVSRYGLVAFASSLDQIGPFGRCVDDVSMLFSAISGADHAHDATSKDFTFDTNIAGSVKGLRIGVPKEYYGDGVQPQVRKKVLDAIEALRLAGAEVKEVSLPFAEYALSVYYIISSAEASSNLARYDGVKYGFSAGAEGGLENMYITTRSEGFGDEVKRRIMLGTYVLSSGHYDAYYKRAKLLQRTIAQKFEQVFEECDLLATPTVPTTAFKVGEKTNNMLEQIASDVCTVPINIAGLPAVSVPCGFGEDNLPIGMQLIGPKFSEQRILTAAKCYEQIVGGFAVKEMG